MLIDELLRNREYKLPSSSCLSMNEELPVMNKRYITK